MGEITKAFESERPVRQKAKSQIYFRTGSALVDELVGGGMSLGYPSGRIANIYGESGAGKTFFACELIAAAHRQYKDKFKWVYDDAEHGFSFDGNALWGVEIIPEDAHPSETVEELFYNVRKFLRGLDKDECGIYIVDSLDALSNEEIEARAEERMKAGDRGETFDKGTFGASAQKFLSQEFFRKLCSELEEKNSLLVFLSQLRDNLNAGPYGEKRRKSGGSALDFYCDTILNLRTKEKFEKNKLVVGVCVEATLKKSKTARPFRSALVNVLFDYGIDDISTNIDYVYDLKSDVTGKLGSNLIINMGDTSDPRFGSQPNTLDGLKEVLVESGLLEDCRAWCKENGRKYNKDAYTEWLKTFHGAIYSAYYGDPITRDELIMKAENDKSVRRMLREKAMQKWEDNEAAVASGRHKYADDEEEY